MQVADPGQVLLTAMEVEALLPDVGGLVHAAEPQRDVAELLGDPGAHRGVRSAGAGLPGQG